MKLMLAFVFAVIGAVAAEPFVVHAHRGAMAVRPENTIPAFQEAIRVGADFIELDVYATRDDVLADVRKGSSTRHDFLACQLLKQNGIFSILGHIVGLKPVLGRLLLLLFTSNLITFGSGRVMVPILEQVLGWTPVGIRALFESNGLTLHEWEKAHTDRVTVRPSLLSDEAVA